MSERFDNRPATLTDYLAVLRRRKWIIIIIPLVSGLVAFEITNAKPPLYQAQATVLMTGAATAVPGFQDPAGDPARFLTTQADIARSPAVTERAVEAAGVRGVTSGQLLGISSVSPRADADVLDVSVSYANPHDAVLLANAYAQEFALYKTEHDNGRIDDTLRGVQARAEKLRKSGKANSLAYQTLIQYQSQLEIAKLNANSASPLELAAGAGQIEPRPRRALILGGLSGLVFALGLAFFLDALDRRVRSSEEIEEGLAIPLLGGVARPSRTLRREHKLVMLAEPASAAAEAYRKLWGTIEFVKFQRGGTVRTIMFTSAIPRDGKSTTIANLAIALARAGRRVVLVDADLRRPFLHSFFGVNPEPGFADVVIARTTLANGLRHVSLPLAGGSAAVTETNGRPLDALSEENGRSDLGPTLHLLPCGTIPPSVGEFLAGDGVSALLGELREQFDVVLVDAPPLATVGDAKTLSAAVDAIVVVTGIGTARPLLQELAHELQNCRAPRLGFIVTGVPHGDRYVSRPEYQSYVQPAQQQTERSEQPL